MNVYICMYYDSNMNVYMYGYITTITLLQKYSLTIYVLLNTNDII